MMKQLRYRAEAALIGFLFFICRILPLDTASAFGGFIGRTVGPRLATSRKALRHIEIALPELDNSDRHRIMKGMWENLGRIITEYPHLEEIGRDRVKVEIDPAVDALLKEGKPCMMIAGHLGNWEIAAAAMLMQLQKNLDLTYRALNNPHADRLLLGARQLGKRIRCYPKSREGGQSMIRAMRDGRYIAMLIDQKYNEGIAVPFFGRPAMTNPAFVQMARKFGYPLVPAQIERMGGANFRITLHKPIDMHDDAETVIAAAHSLLENWIRQRPEQWLWLHRRWDSARLEEEKINEQS